MSTGNFQKAGANDHASCACSDKLTIQNLGFYHHISQQDTPSYCWIKSFDISRKSDISQNSSTLQELKMELMSLNGNISIFINDLHPE